MTLRSIPFTFALAGLLASAPAQKVDTEVRLSLWLDADPGRVATARAMIDSLLSQPAHCETLSQVAKIEVISIHDARVGVELASDNKPLGILQCSVTVTTPAHPTPEQMRALHDQLAVFVDNQLRAVTEERPRRLLREQIQEEQQRWEAASEKLNGQPPGPDLAARAAALQQQRQSLETQIAEARLVLTVESSVRDRLRKQQHEQSQQRAELEERRRKRLDQSMAIQTKAAELRARIDETTTSLAIAKEEKDPQRLATIRSQSQELQSVLPAVQQELARLQAATDDATRALDEFTRTATFPLEQLPTTELLLLRTEVRLQAMLEEHKRLDTEDVQLAAKRATAARAAAAADLLRIDLDVARERLLELKGKLARIEPLRIDVLSGR